eukprot:scaffold287133_cov35-Tisochrysis_lutea.AAC.2
MVRLGWLTLATVHPGEAGTNAHNGRVHLIFTSTKDSEPRGERSVYANTRMCVTMDAVTNCLQHVAAKKEQAHHLSLYT